MSMIERENRRYVIHPKKFAMWLFLVTVTMLFAAFSSAMIVRRADGNWTMFQVPQTFLISTVVIILSSLSMQWAYFAAKKDEVDQNRIALWITLGLAMIFMVTQYIGFTDLIRAKVFIVGNPSGSFFYVITGLHALHVLGGIFFLMATLSSAYNYRVHSRNMLRINLCTTYWHFIGVLWVYLFAILTVLR